MSRSALICLVLSGCFYADEINQRPSIDIIQKSGGEVYRGTMVELSAIANDPEEHLVWFQWRGYACTNADPEPICDREPFYTEVLERAKLVVPQRRTDVAVPVQVVKVLLEGQDSFGATARPIQRLLIPIANHAPEVLLSTRSSYGNVVNTQMSVYAAINDIDDGETDVMLEWVVFSPMNQPAYDLVDLTVPQDKPGYRQFGKTFTPRGVSGVNDDWEIQVTATDPLGDKTVQRLIIVVGADKPPYLAQWSPIAAPAGSSLPITEPTLFQVNVVADDLDAYPAVNDPQLGTTFFYWSILQPGASTWQDLVGVTGNQVALDPANYVPGEIVELRVEIEDRVHTAITCADNIPTCSVISDPNKIQRLTWRVELR